jgi:hypothetical protein
MAKMKMTRKEQRELDAVAAEWVRLMRRHKFKVGQRVRPSQYALKRGMFRGTYRGADKSKASGVVTAVDQFNSPSVRWSYRKTSNSYFGGFIVPDRRPQYGSLR